MSRVIVVRLSGDKKKERLSREEYKLLLESGLRFLSGEKSTKTAVTKYIPGGTVGMKANCLTRNFNSTPVALADALAEIIHESGFDENDIVIWDRTSAELERAGFRLNASAFGKRCFGTDSNGIGYSYDFFSSGKVNSLVSRILTEVVDFNINLPILKDHSIAGLSAGLKNMYGAVHNPNKYHDNNCDPYAAHVSDLKPIKQKNRLIVTDAVRVQYNAGPGYDSRYFGYFNGIIISDDPVAADRIGLEIVERFRTVNGQASLDKAGRPVKYLKTAEQIGLGVADMSRIVLDVIAVGNDGKEQRGELF